ncbi:MOSC domain-containing protein [Deinococcus aestuarii]|uniref:MOSC domain-containing protein n=1 Tax=Deinococcus aestuarii TaxID=2774531 RepID=UPI001C0DEDDB
MSRIQVLSVGLPQPLPYLDGSVPSGFVKTPVSRVLYLGLEGLEDDGQADRQNHGGPDKAVCVYPSEHYPSWQERLGKPLGDAAFGENFTTSGLTEEDACIGDVYQIEQAIVQVSQPRKPCFKLAARHGEPKLTLWVQETGLSGWYFRLVYVAGVGPAVVGEVHREGRARGPVVTSVTPLAVAGELP